MKKPPSIPSTPGVYFFKKGTRALYIGKAQNLNTRIQSYFRPSNGDMRKIRMVQEADALNWLEASSDAEALIMEAEMIKKYRPPYNILMRDDKQYFYVGFTKGEFPKIFLTHQINSNKLPSSAQSFGRARPATSNKKPNTRYSLLMTRDFIGPFTDGAAIKYVLKTLRRAFPYCTCTETHTRPCQQTAIGNCPGICCIEPSRASEFFPDAKERTRMYKKNIRAIKTTLSGKGKRLLKSLEKEMAGASAKKEYEKAAVLRNQIFALKNIFTHTHLLKRDERTHKEKGAQYLADLLGLTGIPKRIEAYDISHTQGKKPVGSMAVFTDGGPDKKEYRHFNIRLPEKPNDTAMIQEIITRRLQHAEWPYPDVMVIDGGKGQLNAVKNALNNFQFPHLRQSFGGQAIFNFQKKSKNLITNNQSLITPKIVALAKREEELYLPNGKIIKLKEGPQPLLHLLEHIRNEAHRFAITHHRKRRAKNIKKQSLHQ